MNKQLLFSVTRKDFRRDNFRAGGKGGQKQNKTSSGARYTHIASGATGESREFTTQPQNNKAAFRRCVTSDKFKAWHKLEVAKRLGLYADIDKKVAEAMREENLIIETYEPV
jgi:protein subunit release factor A